LRLRCSISLLIRRARLAGLALAAAIAAGCGGGSGESRLILGEINALAVRDDGALLIATSTGVYRLGADDDAVDRLGDVRWNVRALALAGDDALLASGNSTRRDPQPARLGLQRSDDGGAQWRGDAFAGKTAFDKIVAAGSWIYALDRPRGVIMISSDRGRNWRKVSRPDVIVDLAVDPSDPQRVIVSERFLSFSSRDGGRRWSELGVGSMLLAWPTSKTLYAVVSEGEVWLSRDRGVSWAAVGELALIPIAFAAGSQGGLYAALSDGTILHSGQGGSGWNVRLASAS
jgi:hypothetical protein